MGWQLPLLKGFQSTNLVNAFILNAIATAIVAFVAVTINDVLGAYEKKLNVHLKRFITFVCTCMSAVVTYALMWLLFGFGGGFLVNGV